MLDIRQRFGRGAAREKTSFVDNEKGPERILALSGDHHFPAMTFESLTGIQHGDLPSRSRAKQYPEGDKSRHEVLVSEEGGYAFRGRGRGAASVD